MSEELKKADKAPMCGSDKLFGKDRWAGSWEPRACLRLSIGLGGLEGKQGKGSPICLDRQERDLRLHVYSTV